MSIQERIVNATNSRGAVSLHVPVHKAPAKIFPINLGAKPQRASLREALHVRIVEISAHVDVGTSVQQPSQP